MRVVDEGIDSLSEYLTRIVDPTFADYQRNPHSARHAFLACVAIYHSVDRVTYPKGPGNLRKKWCKQSVDFALVDMFAHRLKHVRSDEEKWVPNKPGIIPLSCLVNSMEFHNLYFVMRDAINFVRRQVSTVQASPTIPRGSSSAMGTKT